MIVLVSFLGAFAKNVRSDYQLRHIGLSALPPTWNISAAYERILMKFDIDLSKIYQENSSYVKICQEYFILISSQ
jgi:hypothetical protein